MFIDVATLILFNNISDKILSSITDERLDILLSSNNQPYQELLKKENMKRIFTPKKILKLNLKYKKKMKRSALS